MSYPRSSSPLSNVHSAPVAIPAGGHHHRARSDSTSSDSSEGTPPPMTPLNTFGVRAPAVVSSGPGTSPTSPIMSMLAGSSLKSPTTFPFAKMPFSSPVDDEDMEAPVVRHARRASMNAGSTRFVPPLNAVVMQGAHQERGANVLRRLSLGGTFGRANIAPEKPPSPPRGRAHSPRPTLVVEPAYVSSGPPVISPPTPKKRRGNMPTFDSAAGQTAAPGTSPRNRRAPSPMGERILKGHFDSFH